MKTQIRPFILGLGLCVVILAVIGAGSQERVMVTTSQFWRQVLTNEDGLSSLQVLGGITTTSAVTTVTVTNIVNALIPTATNGFTTIVYTNPAYYYPNSNPSNFISGNVIFTYGLVGFSIPWGGPTNFLAAGGTNHWIFQSFTPCAISGFTYFATNVNATILTISNAAATNITFTLPASCKLPLGDTNPYNLTNGAVLKCSIEIADNMTNTVTRVFK